MPWFSKDLITEPPAPPWFGGGTTRGATPDPASWPGDSAEAIIPSAWWQGFGASSVSPWGGGAAAVARSCGPSAAALPASLGQQRQEGTQGGRWCACGWDGTASGRASAARWVWSPGREWQVGDPARQARRDHAQPAPWQSEDGSYTGFIKVHLKLRRPVTVPAGIRPQSIYDAIKDVDPAAATDKRTSFYLPLDAVKQLHISSSTTVSEVIQGLLKKFMVVDNPQKFALFKRIHKDGQGRSERALPQKLPFLTLAGRARSHELEEWASRGPEPSLPCGVGSTDGPPTVPLPSHMAAGNPPLGVHFLICGMGPLPRTFGGMT